MRWIVSTLLVVTLLMSLGETILTDLKRGSSARPGMFLRGSTVLLAESIASVNVILTVICYRKCPLLLALVYWSLALICEIFQLISLMSVIQFNSEMLRFDLLMLKIALYSACVLIEIKHLRTKAFGGYLESEQYPSDLMKRSVFSINGSMKFLSDLALGSLNGLLILAHRRPLELADLGCPPEDFEAGYQYKVFNEALKKEKTQARETNTTALLWRTFGKVYGREIVTSTLLIMMSSNLALIPPTAVGGVVAYASGWHYKDSAQEHETALVTVTEYFRNGFVLIGVLFFALVLQLFIFCHGVNISRFTSVKVKAAVQMQIYEKALHLSSWNLSCGKTRPGQMINHMSVDATVLQSLIVGIPRVITIIYQIIIALILLYLNLGTAAVVGSSTYLLVIPLQYATTKIMSKVQVVVRRMSDLRLEKSTEGLNGMKILKLHGWEETFCSSIEKIRSKEVWQMMKTSFCEAALT
ncbi:ATP-binding cassette sub-family C member 8-like [Ptychodera flava]|uniref:ATP-binding cassette sub-family C member 8-like n=1 Tax=Ptychodera flava TaxID=63121 RepID=UPI00396A5095